MHSFFRLNQRFSFWLDRTLLPAAFSVDGLKNFQTLTASSIQNKKTIFDIGGGKLPFVSTDTKKGKQLRIIGLDIDKNELDRAPEGSYDNKIVSDISTFHASKPFADMVICEAVLEHVKDTKSAITSIANSLHTHGRAFIFMPCRNALFARLNLVLPESMKKLFLYKIFPTSEHGQGFPAFYNNCTPKQMQKIFKQNGLTVDIVQPYYFVSYFSFFAPLHIMWRIGQLLLYPFFKAGICEAFTIVATKTDRTVLN